MCGKLSQHLDSAGDELPPGNHTPLVKSHDSQAGTRSATRMRILRGSIVGLVTIAVTAGCPSETPDRDSVGATSASTTGTEGRPESSTEDFLWPNDGNHPKMRLEIATGDSLGTIEIELMPELAPKSVQRIIELAGDGYYDGTTFHRVIPGFMIQGGDPNSRDHDPSNDGDGGSDTDLPDEFSAAPFARGVVALANHGRRNSNSRQFFIMQSSDSTLNGRYTVVGRVDSGIELVDQIATTATDKVGRWGPKDRPLENIQIQRATVAPVPLDPQGSRPDPADSPRRARPSSDRGPTTTHQDGPRTRPPSERPRILALTR